MCPHQVSSSIRPDRVLGVVTVTLWGVVGVLGVGFFPPSSCHGWTPGRCCSAHTEVVVCLLPRRLILRQRVLLCA